MKRILLISLLVFSVCKINAQFKLVVNEFSQGLGGQKEFVELVVVGNRTCSDSTADIRNWIVDDQNGWYGASGTGIASGHYRFADNAHWQKVPYGSVILLYNTNDKNGNILAADDPTDADHNYVYIVPITSDLIEQNFMGPVSPSAPDFVYPTTGYVAVVSWSSLGLSNSGDGVVVVDPANLTSAEFSIVYSLPGGAGFQTPTVSIDSVTANRNAYLKDSMYSKVASWVIGNAGTSDETPGAGNTPANIAWLNAMRAQGNSFAATTSVTQPTCTASTGSITITSPVGTGYTYSIDGVNFQAGTVFSGLAPKTYTITIKATGGCTATTTAVVNTATSGPDAPTLSLRQPTCTATTGSIVVTAPLGTDFTYSIDGTTFQADTVFAGLAPNTYSITVKTSAGCTSTATATVNAASLTAAPTVTSPVNYCLNAAAVSLSAVGTNLLFYTTATGGTGSATAPIPSTSTAGTTTYYITQTINGCESVRTAIDVITTDFILSLVASPNPANAGDAVTLTTSAATSYQITAWLPAANFTNQTAISQTINPATSSVYFAVGQSAVGCIDTAQVSVVINPPTAAADDIFVPNAFTPNNDGNNDILFVYGNSIRSIDFKIYNQWGQSIFESTNKNKGWDGRYRGVEQPSTVYIYILKATIANGTLVNRKGSVTLVR